ncbi:LiaF transmembrane domain-containing protein [Halalkalibacter urbisdiaboli]|uniref:LiaF transmembrane domain-containing protein n=1 Tax=Halalkalibacter urbisdiaboli TaxID=1960589 RepID=UPI000B42E35D|nr:hypothetical protein [Halalkalibacter urbisdiaboli]
MKRTGKAVGGFLLILIGASLVLSLLGIHLGGLLGVILGIALVYWGYNIYQERGRWSFSSVALIALGAIILFGGLGGIMSLLIGIGLVYGGYRLLKPSEEEDETKFELDDYDVQSNSTYDSIDEEIARLVNK